MTGSGLHHEHARTGDQAEAMRRIEEDGVDDPFDWAVFKKYHIAPVLWQGVRWLVTHNDYPYEGAELHLLLVYHDRIHTPIRVDPEGWRELGEALAWIEREYALEHGAFLMRFGALEATGGTVDHLHAHVIVGAARTNFGQEKLKVTVGYQ